MYYFDWFRLVLFVQQFKGKKERKLVKRVIKLNIFGDKIFEFD